MSALGRYLEEEGLATASISLIRLHSEKMRPPRALWVPFELGRPLGVPNDAAFQTRVLRALIGLLDAKSGPVLADYGEEAPAPDPEDMTGMVCPIAFKSSNDTAVSLADRVRREAQDLQQWYDLSRERRGGRTTFGSAGLDPEALLGFLTGWLDGDVPDSPVAGHTPESLLKLAVEDLKAFYLEAMQAQPSAAGSRELYGWFWKETAAARLMVAIRDVCLASDLPQRRLMATNYLVPRAYFEHFGIAGPASPSSVAL